VCWLSSGWWVTFEKKRHWHLTFGAGMNAPNATLELNGGTLNLGGYKSTFGILDVNASSVIDFNGASARSSISSTP